MTGTTAQVGKRATYPAYKPSGVEWLGDVPEHWDPVRLRYRARINPSRSELNGMPGDVDVSFVPMEAVHEYGGLTLDQTRPLAEVTTGYTYFRDGDVLAAKITPCFENGKGSIADGLVNGIGFGTTELHVLRPCPELDRRFLFYVTISHAFRHLGAAEMYGAGGQKRVPDEFIRDFRQPVPSSDEQLAIAAFLDRETARIDALIERKRRQIELLQEKRSALISHAVTKGLNPNAPMKDSGYPGWQSVPAHWRVTQLRHLTQPGRAIMYGIVLPGPHVEDGVPIVKGGNCEPGRLRLDAMSRTTHEIESRYERSRLRPGDIVYAIRGSIGEAEVVPPELDGANMTQDAARIAPLPDVNNRWLVFAVRSYAFFSHLDAHATGATIRGINIWDLKRAPICVPPLGEQRAIAAYLMRETTHHDELAAKLNKSISQLREYRSALIAAAVTGKIDVREEVTL